MVTIKAEVTLEVDPAAYALTYGVEAGGLADDVQDYLVELLSYCSAATEDCWRLTKVTTRRGRTRRPELEL